MQKSKRHIIFISFLAAVFYGAWAAYVNHDHGTFVATKAGLLQAIYAFLSTFFITQTAHFFYQKGGLGSKGIALGFTTSILVMVTIPYILHYTVSTPNIIKTILPGILWGSIYILGYLISVELRQDRANPAKQSI